MAKISKEDYEKAVADEKAKAVPWGSQPAVDMFGDPYADYFGAPKPKGGGDAPAEAKAVPWGSPQSVADVKGGMFRDDMAAKYDDKGNPVYRSAPASGAPVMFKAPQSGPSYAADFGLKGAGIVPGHLVQTASTQQIKEAQGATEAQKQAALASNAAKVKTQEVQAQENIGLAGVRQQQAIEAQKQEAWRQSQINQHLERQQALMDDIRSEKIDPNKRFKEEGIGGFRAASGVLAQVLGSIGSSLTGGPNYAKDIIDRTLEKDFQSQVENLNTKKAMLGEERSMLGQKMQQFGDQRAAESAMRADTYSAMQALAESNIAYAKTDEQKAAGQEVAAHYGKLASDENRQLNKYVQATAKAADPRLKQIGDLAADLQKKHPNANPEELRTQAAAILGIIPGAGIKPLGGGDEEMNKAAQALIAKGVDPAKARQLAAAGEGKIAATGLEGVSGGGGHDKGLPSAQLAAIGKAKNVMRIIDEEIALRKGEGQFAKMSEADKQATSATNRRSLSGDIVAYQNQGVPDAAGKEEMYKLLPTEHGRLQGINTAINPFASDPIKQLEYQRKLAEDSIKSIEATARQKRGIGGSDDATPEE